jgi:hypothetical protein
MFYYYFEIDVVGERFSLIKSDKLLSIEHQSPGAEISSDFETFQAMVKELSFVLNCKIEALNDLKQKLNSISEDECLQK